MQHLPLKIDRDTIVVSDPDHADAGRCKILDQRRAKSPAPITSTCARLSLSCPGRRRREGQCGARIVRSRRVQVASQISRPESPPNPALLPAGRSPRRVRHRRRRRRARRNSASNGFVNAGAQGYPGGFCACVGNNFARNSTGFQQLDQILRRSHRLPGPELRFRTPHD